MCGWFVVDQVELENLEEYISLVVEATVKGGIGAQIEAFRAGFNQVGWE
jgi:E3 ubiquitin-protein ligase TRIP12